ncbi:MAG: hypothetical protein HYZ42_01080 [Bacteroidetes bacterium]|nr:hypothetical protein [Bacteroidota bacterium]
MRIAIFILFLSMGAFAGAQGSLKVNMSEEVDTLLLKNLEKNKSNHNFSGFRIQVYQGTERATAFEKKKELMALFPDESVYLLFNEPNYKIRIGNYRTKIEAQKLYQYLLTIYPQTFIVPDKIDINELN